MQSSNNNGDQDTIRSFKQGLQIKWRTRRWVVKAHRNCRSWRSTDISFTCDCPIRLKKLTYPMRFYQLMTKCSRHSGESLVTNFPPLNKHKKGSYAIWWKYTWMFLELYYMHKCLFTEIRYATDLHIPMLYTRTNAMFRFTFTSAV